MKFQKSLVLFCLLTALFVSCEKDNQTIGIDMLHDTDMLHTFVDSTSTTISFTTVADDSVRSTLIMYMLGENNDDVIGKSRAGFVTRMYLRAMLESSLDSYTLDSVCFRLSKSKNYVFGDTTKGQSFSVYEIESDITVDECTAYNEKSTIPTCLSNKKEILQIDYPAYNNVSSTYQKKMSDEFAADLFGKVKLCYDADSSIQYFDSLFIKTFKGIYVTTQGDKFNDAGSTISHCVPEITLYVKASDGSTDSLVFAPSPQKYNEPLTTDPSQIYLQAINVFYQDYSSEVSSAIGNKSNVGYVQGLHSLKAKLSLDGIDSWRDSLMVINIATLKLPLKTRDSWSNYLPLNLRIYDKERNLLYSTMSSTKDSTDYTFNLHSFLLTLLNDTKKSDEYSYEIAVPENNAYGNGFILDGTQTDKLKLIITYTK